MPDNNRSYIGHNTTDLTKRNRKSMNQMAGATEIIMTIITVAGETTEMTVRHCILTPTKIDSLICTIVRPNPAIMVIKPIYQTPSDHHRLV